MKDEYDLSTAKRGKVFREGAHLSPSIHLDPEVFDYLSKRASAGRLAEFAGEHLAPGRHRIGRRRE